MSVPEPKREHKDPWYPLETALEMVTYTETICKNRKVFKPEYNDLTQSIVNTAVRIYVYAWGANDVRVENSVKKAKERLTMQKEALKACRILLPLIDIAQKVFHLRHSRTEYWSRLVIKTRNEIRGWNEREAERFARQFGRH